MKRALTNRDSFLNYKHSCFLGNLVWPRVASTGCERVMFSWASVSTQWYSSFCLASGAEYSHIFSTLTSRELNKRVGLWNIQDKLKFKINGSSLKFRLQLYCIHAYNYRLCIFLFQLCMRRKQWENRNDLIFSDIKGTLRTIRRADKSGPRTLNFIYQKSASGWFINRLKDPTNFGLLTKTGKRRSTEQALNGQKICFCGRRGGGKGWPPLCLNMHIFIHKCICTYKPSFIREKGQTRPVHSWVVIFLMNTNYQLKRRSKILDCLPHRWADQV